MDQITSFLGYVSVIAVGAERLTDVIKRMYLEKKEVPGYVYQLITFACGFALCFIQPPEFKLFGFDQLTIAIMVGLTVSGSSSAWHDALGALNNFKKSLEVKPSDTIVK